jgi:carboxypeptidase C (cathepsin A)
LFSGGILAQGQKPPEDEARVETSPQQFVTHHKIQIGEDVLSYTAIAGETIVPDDEGGQKAGIFSVSYIKEGADSQKTRPITFLFNGGPGSSAVWLHLGAFGPRRVTFPSDPENPGAPPYGFSDNAYTLLRFSDLVFVDPVGTGYSHALGKTQDRDYWGVDEDSRIVAEFIRSFLTANNRWNSAKYLIGESYGTIRAAVLIRDLELKPLDGVFFNGVVLLSSANDVRTFMTADQSNELPYVTNLPTYAATAFYHHALPEQPTDRDDFIRQAEAFAGTEYLEALFQGTSLPSDQEQQIAEKLHRFTGLSVEYLKRCHLRVDRNRFLKELLRSRGQTMAMHDTRFLGMDPDEAGERVELDPFLFGMAGPFVATMNEYLISSLDVKLDEPYKIFSAEANQSWKRAGSGRNVFSGYLNTTSYLAAAAASNKDFRVFVANGFHDLTTTLYGTRYVFEHSGIPRERLTLKNYEGGHMMYLVDSSLEQLSEDIGTFMGGK